MKHKIDKVYVTLLEEELSQFKRDMLDARLGGVIHFHINRYVQCPI